MRNALFSIRACGIVLLTAMLPSALGQDFAAGDIYPTSASDVIYSRDGVDVMNGGYGSGLARHPVEADVFYLMTDRGPNFEGTQSGRLIFPVPDFAPQIGVFRVIGETLVKEETILLKDSAGNTISGLPNPVGQGNTGEVAVDLDGNVLAADPDGLDPEGLVALADGTFWVSDEYGPHLVHFGADGSTLERINPFGTGLGGRALPKVLAQRRPNRGMEGLAITPDGTKLVGILQSALDNPASDRAWIRGNSRATRILVFDLATGESRQHIYFQEAASLANSEIRALSNTEFVVLERDGNFPNHPSAPAKYKRFYRIDISGATDVSEPADHEMGLRFDIAGELKTLEQMTLIEILDAGIVPVAKELYLDVLREIPDYPHDKPEGFAILEDGKLAIINDDDFGIASNGQGSIVSKILPGTGEVDHGILYIAEATPESEIGFTLQLIHSSDNESSFQDPNTLEPKLLNYAALKVGLDLLADREGLATLHLTAGDHTLPGPFYQAAVEVSSLGAPGLGDIALFNAMGLAANGIGNHEFDGGIDEFAVMLDAAQYPFLAVNLDFSNVQLADGVPPLEVGVDGSSVAELAGKVARSAWVEVQGEKIGLIGRAPADFFNVVNDPETTLPGLDFVGGRDPATNQPLIPALGQVLEQVDLLKAQGINKIILLDHAQDYTSDPLSASALRDIDVIVAAGSTGFMAQDTPNGPFNLLRPGDGAEADYPTLREDSQGNPVLIINTQQLYRYLGHLIVRFDDQGVVEAVDERSGPIATTAEAIAALSTELVVPTLQPDQAVQDIFAALVATDLIQSQFAEIGVTTEVLNGNRADVRSRETNLGRLTADSLRWHGQEYADSQQLGLTVDIALKNAGGIRDTIQGPIITRLTIGAALAFDNHAAILRLTGEELLAVVENAVSRAPALDGRFPQVSGLMVEYDPRRQGLSDQLRLRSPSRVGTLTVLRADGTQVPLVQGFRVVGDLSQTFTMATLDFLLTGGDGYAALRAIHETPGREALLTGVGEQQIFEDYIIQVFGGTITGFPDETTFPLVDVFEEIRPEGDYASGAFDESAAEIVAYDPLTQRLFVANANQNGVDVLDARDPKNPVLEFELRELGGHVNSVTVKNGILAVAVENAIPQEPGQVVFFDTVFGGELNRVQVGAMPDMLTFTPDGTRIVTANEGEPNDAYTVDPEGTISIIELGGGTRLDIVRLRQSDVTTLSFAPYNFLGDILESAGVRVFGRINSARTGRFLRRSTLAEDLEPEYVAISPDSTTAYVVMQENNAMAVVDLATKQLVDLVPFGYKDHSREGFGFDASDRDGGIHIQPHPVLGMYLPDAIAAFETLGQVFLITANEGDARDYEGFSEQARVSSLTLDPTAYPNALELQANDNLGRLQTTTSMGDFDGDGDYDQIFSYGGRSFSIWDQAGNLVFDSGDAIERITAEFAPADFNSTNNENDSFDSRSDDKGPEPEALAVGEIDGRIYAFIGLERIGGILMYDITYPHEPKFVRYLNTRDFGVTFTGEDGTPTEEELDRINDLGPEGLIFVAAADSPTGTPLLIAANEVSGNTRLHTLRVAPPAEFKLQILHSSDNESAFQNPNTLEPTILNYGAIVSGLQTLAAREGLASIYVTAGDHTLPGPFYQAAAEVRELGAPGLADIAFYNAMGLLANGIGNHEFDEGIADFARMLSHANYPFLAVNLDFSNVLLPPGAPNIEIGEDGASVESNAGKVARSSWVWAGGEKIGLIGHAPADLFNVIEDPAANVPGLDFVGGRDPVTNQPLISSVGLVLEQVALLEAQGINKIVLLDHAQDYTADPLAAEQLRGIDIIVAAGATGFMARPDSDGPFNLLRPGDTAEADYPAVLADNEGFLVLVVNSDQLYRYVGQLIVGFDVEGHIDYVDDRSGPVASTEEAMVELETVLNGRPVVPQPEVTEIYLALQETDLILEQFEPVGTTIAPLVGAREQVRSRETNLGQLAADSTLWYAQAYLDDLGVDLSVDVALKNGGGIRNSIVGPQIIRLLVANALAFDNQLSIVELRADELIAAMENAVSRVPALDGRFPQIAGMYLEYDPDRPALEAQASVMTPSRVRTLIVHRADGTEDVIVANGEAQGDPGRRVVFATNSFLLTGGDGYLALKSANDDPARTVFTTDIGEQQILIDYVQQVLDGEVDLTEPLADRRVVRYFPTLTFTAWQTANLPLGQPGIAADEDFDEDGLTNYREYLFARNPVQSDTEPTVRIRQVEDMMTTSYTRRSGTGLTWTYEGTTELGNGGWTALNEGEDFTQTITPHTDGTETVVVSVPGGVGQKFVRIHVE